MKALIDDAAHFGSRFHGLVTEVEHRNLMEHYKKMGMLELEKEKQKKQFLQEKKQQEKQN